MIPTVEIEERVMALLSTDTATLAPATDAVHVHLVNAAFTPNRALTVADLSLATFTGSAAKSAGVGAQQNFQDPVTGASVVQLKEPAGGWTWICTADPASPETIFGYAVTDNGDTDLYGTDLLPNGPVEISSTGQAIIVGAIHVSLPPGALTDLSGSPE